MNVKLYYIIKTLLNKNIQVQERFEISHELWSHSKKYKFQQNGFTKLFIDKMKSIVLCTNIVLVLVLRNALPNSKVCVKTESLYFNNLLPVSPISHRKTDLLVANKKQWRGSCEIDSYCRPEEHRESGDCWKQYSDLCEHR